MSMLPEHRSSVRASRFLCEAVKRHKRLEMWTQLGFASMSIKILLVWI